MKATANILGFLKKHRDRSALIGLLLGLIIFIGVGLTLQNSRKNVVIESDLHSKKKQIKLHVNKSGSSTDKQSLSSGTVAFFLRPSPTELLEQLASMEDLNEAVVNAKFSGLRMLWSAYFFSLEDLEGENRRLLADVSNDGFGVMIKADVKVTEFPQLVEIDQGQKIWLGGELLAIDPAGTGVIYMKVEHVTVGDEPVGVLTPPSAGQNN